MSRLFIPIFLTFLLACQPEGPPHKPFDLNAYKIPIVIQAPDSAEVLEKNYSFMRDITIKKGTDYDIQIFELESGAVDAAGEKLHQLESVKEDPYFVEVIKEEDYGFIFSKRIDSVNVDYDFRYVQLLQGKEIIFQTGLGGSYSLDQVRRMYRAVRQ